MGESRGNYGQESDVLTSLEFVFWVVELELAPKLTPIATLTAYWNPVVGDGKAQIMS